ncbi:MAG: type II secretion system protein [Dehalogenimonas sp.]|uniref:Type II secretion system protein n=1 Tax=Candidatus Dehalogenimonas loeffleri TaxID=3127115 RepID=A0ABZ2J1B7_9CHLR|nr:type II secretion system protein [Dehalogenimonas sp.]
MKFLENLKMKKLRKGQKGFTLIELLVVIAILGVIAAVAVPNIISFIGSGETEAAAAELHNVTVAVTAALVAGDGTIIGYSNVVIPAKTTPANDPGTYLLSTTQWKYTIGTTGTIAQGAKA